MRMTRFIAFLALAITSACSQPADAPPPELEHETFIEVWVEIRSAAVGLPGARVPEAVRDEILARYDVTADELLAFADFYGQDPDEMDVIWEEVERRLNDIRIAADTIN